MKENKLQYSSPAKDWNEALPLGNGKLGMMVFGGVSEERIQLNEETFWSGWECTEYDNPQTFEHLDEMRQLIFDGKYAEAQQLCNRYMVCHGKGDTDSSSAFGSYQTAGDLYITAPHEDEDGYHRELILDEGRSIVTFAGTAREYFVSHKYNTAVIRITGDVEKIKIRYERLNTEIVQNDHEILACGYLPTRFTVLIRDEIKRRHTKPTAIPRRYAVKH